jgi:hypothetical protein
LTELTQPYKITKLNPKDITPEESEISDDWTPGIFSTFWQKARSGTAKTSSVLMYSNKFKEADMLLKRVNFSSATRPSAFQETIDVECDFKVGKDFAHLETKI